MSNFFQALEILEQAQCAGDLRTASSEITSAVTPSSLRLSSSQILTMSVGSIIIISGIKQVIKIHGFITFFFCC